MYYTRCPACGKTAMTLWAKFTAGRLTCGQCQRQLRLNFEAISTLAIIVAAICLGALWTLGMQRLTFVIIAVCLLSFVLIGILIPFEVSDRQPRS